MSFIYTPPSFTTLDILHQDEHLLIVNKPAGLLSVPGRGVDKADCMLSRVQLTHPQALVVHRLDMATSGVIIFALNKITQAQMGRIFEKRQIQKHYLAQVYGCPATHHGVIEQPLITNWPQRPKQKIDYRQGKYAKTLYEVINEEKSLIKLTPVTGRSHQLRVHMSSLGHPILGDHLYGTSLSRNASRRLLLHATDLIFDHPVFNNKIHIECKAEFS